MIEALIALGGILVGWVVRELIKSGAHKKEHEMIIKTQDRHTSQLFEQDKRLDANDIVNATIMTQLQYITAGIDEIKKEIKKP